MFGQVSATVLPKHSSDLYLYVIARLCPKDEYHNVLKDDDVRTLAWAQRSPVVSARRGSYISMGAA